MDSSSVLGEQNFSFFGCLPDVPLEIIVSFLPTRKNLLVFEQLFTGAMRYTIPAWKKHMQRENLNFNWSLPEGELYPTRACYFHGKALAMYCNVREKLFNKNPDGSLLGPTSEQVQKLFLRFRGIMERYPSSLGAFLWKDLNSLHRLNSSHYHHLFQRDFSVESKTGDLLLKGLSYLVEHPFEMAVEGEEQQKFYRLAFKSLNGAIQEGATCASLLAIRILCPKYKEADWYYNLALASAIKGDWRGLDLFVVKFPEKALEFFNKGISYPPILAAVGCQKMVDQRGGIQIGDLSLVESLLDEAIKDYKDRAPAYVYEKAALAKFHLEKLKEAEDYYDKAIVLYDNRTPAIVYCNASFTKIRARKWEEAKNYSDQAIVAYGNDIPPAAYGRAAYIEFGLGKFKAAKDYYDKAVASWGTAPVTDILVDEFVEELGKMIQEKLDSLS